MTINGLHGLFSKKIFSKPKLGSVYSNTGFDKELSQEVLKTKQKPFKNFACILLLFDNSSAILFILF